MGHPGSRSELLAHPGYQSFLRILGAKALGSGSSQLVPAAEVSPGSAARAPLGTFFVALVAGAPGR